MPEHDTYKTAKIFVRTHWVWAKRHNYGFVIDLHVLCSLMALHANSFLNVQLSTTQDGITLLLELVFKRTIEAGRTNMQLYASKRWKTLKRRKANSDSIDTNVLASLFQWTILKHNSFLKLSISLNFFPFSTADCRYITPLKIYRFSVAITAFFTIWYAYLVFQKFVRPPYFATVKSWVTKQNTCYHCSKW